MAPPPPSLPADLLLEITARTCDVATVVRCAATCKPLRRTILNHLAAMRAAANGGFDPACLSGVSYQVRRYDDSGINDGIVVNTSRRPRIDGSLMGSFEPACFCDGVMRPPFEPACSCDGALVLWRNKPHERNRDGGYSWVRKVELLVYDVFTSDVISRPPELEVRCGICGIDGGFYRPALLAMEGAAAGHSFKLLILDRRLRIQTFSPQDGEWGGARHVHSCPVVGHVSYNKVCGAPAAVIGSTVHWLCHLNAYNPLNNVPMAILAVRADTAEATAIQLPEDCLQSLKRWSPYECYRAQDSIMLVATTTDEASSTTKRTLGLLLADPSAISMWTLATGPGEAGEGSNVWSRQVVIRRREIKRQLDSGLATYQPIRFKAFGERSGTVVFWIDWVGLVQLSLVTKKVVLLCAASDDERVRGEGWACLHEVDMASLLRAMKPF